jgi:hypothetical protein
MDIHKPKPWHGWREFLKEYVIIVVGVLTALAAEQSVEWLHWRHMAQHAEVALAEGIVPDLINAAGWVAIEPCLKARVSELATELQKPAGPWKANVLHAPDEGRQFMPAVIANSSRTWPHIAWDSALNSGALSHIPRERVDSYADLYRISEVLRDGQNRARALAPALSVLAFDRPLTAAERTGFLRDLALAADAQRSVVNGSRILLNLAEKQGLRPPAKDLAKRIREERQNRGDCVQDIMLPLR